MAVQAAKAALAWVAKTVLTWVAKAVLTQAAKTASLGDQEQVPMIEQAVESVAPGLVQESADELPMTESPSEEQESVSSVGQKWKVNRTFWHNRLEADTV